MRDLLGGVIAKSWEVLHFAQDDGDVVVPNVVRDLLDWVIAKSWEVLRVAQDDGGVVVPNVVRDLLGGLLPRVGRSFALLRMTVVLSS
ncbi:Uncharacterised protein [Legionella maceachernii]|uniref:hypothetical protein n=1 Tax=Legionella maceachernii TaxID=466 RepID=UPI000E05DB34|nr:hypothetical protein [Legionella maceachernii]SUP01783.1 Uncharacterised protein [Legionella maceachernii]